MKVINRNGTANGIVTNGTTNGTANGIVTNKNITKKGGKKMKKNRNSRKKKTRFSISRCGFW